MKSKGVLATLKESEVGFTTHHFTHGLRAVRMNVKVCAVQETYAFIRA